MNRQALARLQVEKRLAIVPGATHLFEEPGALEQDLVFIGLAGMIDPARPEVAAAVEVARIAGIRTVSSKVAALFTDNDGVGPNLADGFPFFDSDNHNNVIKSKFSFSQATKRLEGDTDQITPVSIKKQSFIVIQRARSI